LERLVRWLLRSVKQGSRNNQVVHKERRFKLHCRRYRHQYVANPRPEEFPPPQSHTTNETIPAKPALIDQRKRVIVTNAGIFFDLTGAAASCAMSGSYGAYVFRIFAPPIIAGLPAGKLLKQIPRFGNRGIDCCGSLEARPCPTGLSHFYRLWWR
jgi:hypothetical protein